MNMADQPSKNSHVSSLIWKHSSDAIFALDYQGEVIDANAAFYDLLGYQPEQLQGRSIPPFMVDGTEEKHRNRFMQLKQGKHFPYEIVKRKSKDGEMLDVLASYWPVNDGNILAIGIYKDFTEQMKFQKKLAKSEYYYRILVEHLPEAIVLQRYNWIQWINTAGCQFFGVEKAEDAVRRSIWDFVSSEKQEEIQHIMDSICKTEAGPENAETIVAPFEKNDGEKIWAEVKVIPIGDEDEPNVQIVFRDVTEKKKYESQLEYFAYHDPLTGLKNRRRFSQMVKEAIKNSDQSKEKFAIVYLDMDDFKVINDTYGHDVGDQVLQKFAKRIQSTVRDQDIPCRVGGDEFLVLLRNIHDKEGVKQAVARMQRVFSKPYAINGHSLHLTCSIGTALFPEDGRDLRTLIHQADMALYAMKGKG